MMQIFVKLLWTQVSRELNLSLEQIRLELVAFATLKEPRSSVEQEHNRIDGIL